MKSHHSPPLLRLLRLAGLALGLGAIALPVYGADVYVIVPVTSPLRSLSTQEVADLYLGRTRSYPNGGQALVLDQPSDKIVREQFFRLLVNMPLPQVNAYWARLTFTGRQRPPKTVADDTAVLQLVASNEQAIGYVGSKPSDPGVRVVLYLQD